MPVRYCHVGNCARADVEYRIEPREIKARLDAPMVQAVMKMGYSRDIIRKVIERRLVSTGNRQSLSLCLYVCKVVDP